MRLIPLILIVSTISCKSDKKFSFANTKKKEPVVVFIQPFDRVDEKIINDLQAALAKTINAEINILPQKDFPPGSYYKPRRRYWADSIIHYLQTISQGRNYYIGVTAKDISVPKNNMVNYGVMGLGFMPGNACVISSFRLGNKKDLDMRLYKVAIHELGHNNGLPHCKENGCYMMDAEGKMKLDNEHFFCTRCRKFLVRKSFL